MADIFGAVTAGMGLAGIFKACADCFEYVQLGRKFSVDFTKSQAKLDIIRLPLARWGELTDMALKEWDPKTKEEETAAGTMRSLLGLFEDITKTTKKYTPKPKKGQDLP